MADAHKNFSYSTILTAPSPATSGTSLVVQSGDGAKFPTPPFNATVWPTGVQPLTTNAEIVRVTAIATDTFTITRLQESTSARSIVVGDQIAATITVKTITDIESSEITGKIASDANSTYTDNSSYWSKAIATDGWVVNGILTGTRKGIEHTQRIQDVTNANTYARVWLNGSTAWGAWSLYLDSSDFTAKGQTHFASASNVAGVITVGANDTVLTADSAAALGVKWAAPASASGFKQILVSKIN